MLLIFFVTVFLFRVEAHIKFTECQAEYYRSQPGNENVVFDTDGPPCQNKRNRRGLTSQYYMLRWYNYLKDGKRIVPYFFEDGYENHQFVAQNAETGVVYGAVNVTEAMERIEEMLDLFKEYTCVEFLRLRTEEEKNQYDYKIMIVHDENKKGTCESWSKLGRLYIHDQPQRINMCPYRVMNNNITMQHEAMHALGFRHEQSRPDRDDYVEVHPSLKGNVDYAKLWGAHWVNTSSPYDFDSIMQYSSNPVGNSDEYDISVPGSNYKMPITANQVFPFSEQDIKQINYAYCPENKSLLEKSLEILTVILTFFSSW